MESADRLSLACGYNWLRLEMESADRVWPAATIGWSLVFVTQLPPQPLPERPKSSHTGWKMSLLDCEDNCLFFVSTKFDPTNLITCSKIIYCLWHTVRAKMPKDKNGQSWWQMFLGRKKYKFYILVHIWPNWTTLFTPLAQNSLWSTWTQTYHS